LNKNKKIAGSINKELRKESSNLCIFDFYNLT